MRVLYLNPTADLYGSSRCLLSALDCIDPDRVQPVWVLPGRGPLSEALRRRSVHYRVLPDIAIARKGLLGPASMGKLAVRLVTSSLRLAWLVRKLRVDVIDSNSAVVMSGALAARLARVPHVWHMRELLAHYRSFWRFYGPLMLHNAQQVPCASAACADQFRGYKQAGKAFVLYDGVDWSRVTTPLSRPEARLRWGLPQDSIVVGCASYLNPRKGVDVLLEAYARVRQRAGSTMRLILAGRSYAGYEEFEQQLRARAAELGLADEVLFVGFVEDMATFYAALDVFAMPSSEEAFGMSTVEAMAARLPVVATRQGGVPEVVDDGRTGLLVPTRSVDGVVEALWRLVDSPELRVRMGEAGRELVRARFSVERTASAMQAMYASLGRA